MPKERLPGQREAELDAVLAVLGDSEWHRPSAIARQTNLNTAVVLSALRVLNVLRREYITPRLHHGRDRIRKTSRLIVEYRLVTSPVALYPSFLLPPAPNFQGVVRRITNL